MKDLAYEAFLQVLILVLMEDTLREDMKASTKIAAIVLILVLMEDTLRVKGISKDMHLPLSLNPCFNGRYSQSKGKIGYTPLFWCLNPCFNGRYSQRYLQRG